MKNVNGIVLTSQLQGTRSTKGIFNHYKKSLRKAYENVSHDFPNSTNINSFWRLPKKYKAFRFLLL